MSAEDRAPWAKRIANQDEKMAQQFYDIDAKIEENYGPQPFDPETGEPQERIPELEQEEMHAIIRNSDIGMLMTLMGEAERLGLSDGVLPRRMVKGMITAERRWRQLPMTDEDIEWSMNDTRWLNG